MLGWLFFLWMMDQGSVVRFEGTEVFQPLDREEVLVSPSGYVYILNFQDAYINYYSPDGQKIGKIGSRGKGPGEFTYAVQILLQEGKLYVYDLLENQISVFSDTGKFQRRVTVPARGLKLVKVNSGWIYGNWEQFGLQELPALFWVDEEFKQSRKLVSLEEKGEKRGLMVMTTDGKSQAKYSAIDTIPTLLGGLNGQKAYLVDGTRFRVEVIDHKGQMSFFERKEKKIPFDTDWAAEQLAEAKENDQKLPKVETNYPEFFPAIREVIVDPDGHLVIDRWRGRPDDHHFPIAMDDRGQEVPLKYPWEVLERIVGFTDGFLFLTMYDKESEQAFVARVPAENVVSFATAHPIEFEGSAGRTISISN